MFRLLTYPRVKLRSDSSPVMPVCPVENLENDISAMLDGTKLSFRCPIHYPHHSNIERLQPKRDMVQDFHGHIFQSGKGESESQRCWSVFKRSWAFNGKWFSGVRGQLNLYAGVYQSSLATAELSLFNPKVFKYEIGDFIDHFLDVSLNLSDINWVAPVNWRMEVEKGGISAEFEAVPNVQRSPNLFNVRPISANKYLVFCFEFVQFAPGDQKKRDSIVDIKNMRGMADRIIDSIKIELSDSSKAELASAIEVAKSYEADSDFPPIQWGAESKAPLTLPI